MGQKATFGNTFTLLIEAAVGRDEESLNTN